MDKSPIKYRMETILADLANEGDGKPMIKDSTDSRDTVDLDQLEETGTDDEDKDSELVAVGWVGWATFAENLFMRHCKLIVDPGSSSGIAEAFKGSGVSNVHLEEGKRNILVIFDSKAMGEASARAHLRTCPLREEYLMRAVRGILQATTDGQGIPSAYIFALFDGFLHGNESRLLKAFTAPDGSILKKDKKHLFLTFTEDSMKEAKGRLAGTATMHLVEFAHLVSEGATKVPEKKHLHIPGTNRSDWLGSFEKPSRESDAVMKVKHSRKPALLGPALIACGNRVDGDLGPENDPPPRPHDNVPMNWHTMDIKVYEEFIHSYGVEGIVDLTANDGTAAFCAVQLKKPYFGVCFTDEHLKEMRRFVIGRIFTGFQTAGSKLYEPTMKKVNQDELQNTGNNMGGKTTVGKTGGEAEEVREGNATGGDGGEEPDAKKQSRARVAGTLGGNGASCFPG